MIFSHAYASNNGLEKITKNTIFKINIVILMALLPFKMPKTLAIIANNMTNNPGRNQNMLVNIIETTNRNDNKHKIPETKLMLFKFISCSFQSVLHSIIY